MISITEAAEQGIDRLRRPIWVNPLDHLKIDIIDGKPGPWGHLFCPFNKECNGRDPVDFLMIYGAMKTNMHAPEYVPYEGPLPDSDEYRAAVAAYDGCLGEDRAVARTKMPKLAG